MKISNKKAGFSALTFVMLFLIFGVSLGQSSIEDLKNAVSDRQSKLSQINSEIQNLQKQITSAQKQAASLKNEVVLFDLQIKQTENQINSVTLEIEDLAQKIADTQATISKKQEAIEKQKEFLSETLRLINEYDAKTALEITLGNDTFSQFLDQVQYVTNLDEKTQDLLDTIKKLKAELEEKKKQLVGELNKQEELKTSLDIAMKSLQKQRDQKQYLLAITRGQEKIYKTMLSEASTKQDQVEREIFQLEVDIRSKLGDKTLPPIAGLLQWPMSGILTQGYGKTGFTALGYNFHNGLDIAAPAGTPIYAAGDGVVYATGTGAAAYGNWVVVKHTLNKDGKLANIFTLYGHLEKAAVSAGKAVRGGDLVGYEGNTGNTTRLLYGPERGYHLHFTVFDEDGFGIKEGAYQDLYGPYQIPYGYTYNPIGFLQ